MGSRKAPPLQVIGTNAAHFTIALNRDGALVAEHSKQAQKGCTIVCFDNLGTGQDFHFTKMKSHGAVHAIPNNGGTCLLPGARISIHKTSFILENMGGKIMVTDMSEGGSVACPMAVCETQAVG